MPGATGAGPTGGRNQHSPGLVAPGEKGGECEGLPHPARRLGTQEPFPRPAARTCRPARPPPRHPPCPFSQRSGPGDSQFQPLVGRGRHPAPPPPSSSFRLTRPTPSPRLRSCSLPRLCSGYGPLPFTPSPRPTGSASKREAAAVKFNARLENARDAIPREDWSAPKRAVTLQDWRSEFEGRGKAEHCRLRLRRARTVVVISAGKNCVRSDLHHRFAFCVQGQWRNG